MEGRAEAQMLAPTIRPVLVAEAELWEERSPRLVQEEDCFSLAWPLGFRSVAGEQLTPLPQFAAPFMACFSMSFAMCKDSLS